MAAPLAVGLAVSALMALRVSYGLAATAVDVPFSPRLSWAYGRGNGWTIIGALFLTFVVSALATTVATVVVLGVMRGLGAREAAAVVTWTAAFLVSYGGAGLIATVQAVIFRRLLAWREGAPLPALTG